MAEVPKDLIIWKPMGLEDLPRIADWFSDFEDIALFERSLPVPVNIDVLQEVWRAALEHSRPPNAFWFIAEDAENRPLGIGGLDAVNYIQGDAVMPFFVARSSRNKGLATAMTVSILDLAFRQLRLHRVTTYYRADNTPTERTLEKFGFSQEGRFREAWFDQGVRKDIVISGILGAEWVAKRESILKNMDGAPILSAPSF